MESEPRSLQAAFTEAESKRAQLADSYSTSSPAYQENLAATISCYSECIRTADRVSLFSPNETLEDISSNDLQYLLLNFWLAELTLKLVGVDRKANLVRVRGLYERFLRMLDSYDMLAKSEATMFQEYLEGRDEFSTASTSDAVARRATKIARFREEKELKRKLELLRQNPRVLADDDSALRELHLTNITLRVHETFQSLESIALEVQMLARAPPPLPSNQAPSEDRRETERDSSTANGYSERLDGPINVLTSKTGPILSKDGKPLRPFTLLDSRQTLQQGVFRPDHSLPTMSIDEYLEEERKRGGIIEGGGEKSGLRPEPEEDNYVKADEETMKARAWDEFKDENPRGSGNTLNRG